MAQNQTRSGGSSRDFDKMDVKAIIESIWRDEGKPWCTVTDVAIRGDVSKPTARERIGELVGDGRLKKEEIGRVHIYWLPEVGGSIPRDEIPESDRQSQEIVEKEASTRERSSFDWASLGFFFLAGLILSVFVNNSAESIDLPSVILIAVFTFVLLEVAGQVYKRVDWNDWIS